MAKSSSKDNGTKIQLSLAATMFFAPFVKHILSKGHLDISDDDKNFVKGYIRLGYLTILALFVTLAGLGSWYLLPGPILRWVYLIGAGILIALLIFGTGAVIANVAILQGDSKLFHYESTEVAKKDILLSYIPLYNIYLRYKLHEFEHPYWWAKESILMWTGFLLITILTKNITLSSFMLILIIIRVASLLGGMDVLDKEIKKTLSSIFTKNPEEIWGYVTGLIKYLYQKATNKDVKNYKEYITQQKKVYESLIDIKKGTILLQYVIGLLLIVGRFFIGYFDIYVWIYFVPIALIIGRYGIMVVKRKHLPPLPIAKEISELIMFVYQKINNKISKSKVSKK